MRQLLLTSVLACFTASAVADDPFLWLEEVQSPRSLEWVKQHNTETLKPLLNDPRFATLQQEALTILNSDARLADGKIMGDYIYNFWQGPNHKRGLWRRMKTASYTQGAEQWETVLDMEQLEAKEHQNWIFHGYDCLSPAYEKCFISLSRGGTDASVYREFSLKSKQFVANGFELPEAKSRVAWEDENTWLVGTDWGEASMSDSGYPIQIKRWKRGEPLHRAKLIYQGEKQDMLVNPMVYGADDHRWTISHRMVSFYNRKFYLHGKDNQITPLPLPAQTDLFGLYGDALLVARINSAWFYQGIDYPQGALVGLNLNTMKAETIYQPSAKEAVEQVGIGHHAIFVALLDNVIGKAKVIKRNSGLWQASPLPLPKNGTVSLKTVDGKHDTALFNFESMNVPESLFWIDAKGKSRKLSNLPDFYDASDVVVEQRFATSTDGTQVPYFIMAQKSVLEKGNAPTIQYGYGGFKAAILPTYYEDPSRPQHGALAGRMWVKRGGVLVLSNIRGGGELGPKWHQAALKQHRQRAYDDFFAVAEALIADGVTTPSKLGAVGRSNGGLLMGVALTQRPDLYAAVDIGVPLLDMKRYNKLLAGASWMGEYGNPDIPEQWAYISKYSPYQNLKAGVDYPKVLFYTSTKDDRVHPGHARKMAAKLEQMGHEVFYYENIEGGHGGTANQEQLAFRTALEYIYFMHQLMPKAQ